MMPEWLASQVLAVLVAWLIDLWLGEPSPRWHPVVWIGRYLQRAGDWLQADARAEGDDWRVFWRGAAAWGLGAGVVVLLALLVQLLLSWLPWTWTGVLLGVLLKPLFSWRMLADEVAAVETALAQSLHDGQQQLARIVSRDVTVLDAVQVRESALESLSENLNDSVIAPLFWFLLLGLPGAALFRFADTADSMWGYRGIYRGRRWEWAGKWAARADDVLAWLPARLTGIGLLLAVWPRRLRLSALRREAAQTPSPNSGWPMAAMALGLDVQLRKPGVYTLHAAGAQAQPGHVPQAIRLAQRAVAMVLPGLLGLAWLTGILT